jgi:type IV pilus assembly protein PilF
MKRFTQIMRGLLIVSLVSACATEVQREQQTREQKAAKLNVRLGIAYLNRGDLELANTKLERALHEDPDLPEAHWSYALLQRRLGKAKLAEQHFREALSLDPQDSRAHNNYAVFLCEQQRFEQAQEQFVKAAENPLYPEPESAYTRAGKCVLRIPDTQSAERYFRKALRLNPKYTPALFQMAKLMFNTDHYLKARGYVQRLEQLSQHTAESLWISYQTERHLGDLEKADVYARQMKRRFPQSRETTLLLEYERHGK